VAELSTCTRTSHTRRTGVARLAATAPLGGGSGGAPQSFERGGRGTCSAGTGRQHGQRGTGRQHGLSMAEEKPVTSSAGGTANTSASRRPRSCCARAWPRARAAPERNSATPVSMRVHATRSRCSLRPSALTARLRWSWQGSSWSKGAVKKSKLPLRRGRPDGDDRYQWQQQPLRERVVVSRRRRALRCSWHVSVLHRASRTRGQRAAARRRRPDTKALLELSRQRLRRSWHVSVLSRSSRGRGERYGSKKKGR